MTRPTRQAWIALLLMLSAALGAWALTPRHKLVDRIGRVDLESVIPKAVGEWVMDERTPVGIVNPQQTEMLKKIYGQTLTRSYVNRQTGDAVMLSIAYGEDQRDGMQMHYPEVCYPAQGFELKSNRVGALPVSFGEIPVRRLETVGPGGQRFEPVTYWTLIGSIPSLGGIGKKLAEVQYSLRGEIPDGLLYRVSSIDRDSNRAFGVQADFTRQMLEAMSGNPRMRIGERR